MSAAPSQAAFAAAVLDPHRPVPPGLVAWNGSDPAARLAVYRNNVATALADALADAYPVVRALVGEPFFAGLARAFAARHPPRTPVLARWGGELAAFLETFAPAAELPYLPDVARLEHLRVRAFHAPDAPLVARDAFEALLADPRALESARVMLHPSVGVVRSRHAVLSLWAAHHGAWPIETVDPSLPESALVARPDLDVETHRLPPGGGTLVVALDAGEPLGAAAARAAARRPDFEPARCLEILIRARAVTAVRTEPGDRP